MISDLLCYRFSINPLVLAGTIFILLKVFHIKFFFF